MTKINWSEAATNAISNGDKRWQDAGEGIILGINDLLEDETLPVGVKLLLLGQLTAALNNRDQMVAFATGRPVAAIGGGNGNDEAEQLRQRISELEQQLEDETTAKEDLERRLDVAEGELDINVVGSTAHKLEEAESQNTSLKKDRALLEAIAGEFGVAVPANTNTPFARDTAQKVKDEAKRRVDNATAAAGTFDEDAAKASLKGVLDAANAQTVDRVRGRIVGRDSLKAKIKDHARTIGLGSAPSPTGS